MSLDTLEIDDEDWLELEREYCSRSLANFTKQGWHILEPAEELKWGWALDAICEHLEAVNRGQITQLLMNVPPGTMKSLLTGVFFPSWEWGPKGRPALRYLGTAHRETLAVRDSVKCRRLIESDWYQRLWPIELTSDQNAKTKFENTKTGFREAMPFGSMTGARGDRIIIDDPLSVDDAESPAVLEARERTFLEALPSRRTNDRAATIVIMQRLHERDTSGIIAAKELDYVHLSLPMEFEPERRCYTVVRPTWMGDDPERVAMRYLPKRQMWLPDGLDQSSVMTAVPNLPAEERVSIWEAYDRAVPREVYDQDPRHHDGELLFIDRFPRHDVDRLKKSLGAYGTAGQLQQRPSPREGGLFKRHWFNPVTAVPAGTQFVRGWDLAASKGDKSPYTAGVKIGRTPEGRIIIAHAVRERESPAGVERLIKTYGKMDGYSTVASIPQDPGQAGKAQVSYFAGKLIGMVVKFSPESGDKITRAKPLASQAEAGNVDLLVGPWNEAFLDELTNFPNSEFADYTDAASRAFAQLVDSGYTLANVG